MCSITAHIIKYIHIHEKYNKYMDCVNKINEKCFSFLFIEENNVLIDAAY